MHPGRAFKYVHMKVLVFRILEFHIAINGLWKISRRLRYESVTESSSSMLSSSIEHLLGKITATTTREDGPDRAGGFFVLFLDSRAPHYLDLYAWNCTSIDRLMDEKESIMLEKEKIDSKIRTDDLWPIIPFSQIANL